MNWFRRGRAGNRPASAQLLLEQLEDRRVLSVSYHGGPVISHVRIEPVFLGSYWNSSAGQQQAADLDNFLSYVTDSSYMDMLSEYAIGRGALADKGVTDATPSGATLDDSTIRNLVDSDIQHGQLQPPNGARLYIVFTAPNVDVTYQGGDSANNFYGYHDAFTVSTGQRAYYAVIAHPIGNGDYPRLSDFQTLTKVTSHELAEAVTDPDVGGWYNDPSGDEIGDLVRGTHDYGYLNGYVVQAEWLNSQNASVLPADATSAGPPLESRPTPTVAAFNHVAGALAHSGEYFAHIIRADYLHLLGRTPAQSEIDGWVSVMQRGVTDEQVMTGFIASPEYYQHAGGTDQAWVDALYRDVLGRAADQAGETAWLHGLAGGTSRNHIALGFTTSVEHEEQVIAIDYQTYLGRSPGASEVAGWVNAYAHGTTNENIVTGFVASSEFFKRQGGTPQAWLTAAYQAILERAPDEAGFGYWLGILEGG